MYFSIVAILFPLTLASPLATPSISGQDARPTLAPLSATGEHIEDSYVVVFKQGVNLEQIALHLSGVEEWHGADVRVPFILLPVA